jgi:hypothetical protein
MKRSTRAERGRIMAQERDGAALALAKAPFAEAEREWLALEKRLLRLAATDWEQLEVRRGTAKDILNTAHGADVTAQQLTRAVRRFQRLGYTDLAMRVHVACLFVQMLPSFPRMARQAFTMLDDAERRLLRLRKRHYLRREGMQATAHARKVAVQGGITQPASSSGR